MKMNPLLKSILVVIILSVLFFLSIDYCFDLRYGGVGNFGDPVWAYLIPNNLFYFIVPFFIGSSYSVPFFLKQKCSLERTLFLFFTTSIFISLSIYLLDKYSLIINEKIEVYLHDFLQNNFNIQEETFFSFIIFPLGIFLLTKVVTSSQWYLLLLLAFVLPTTFFFFDLCSNYFLTKKYHLPFLMFLIIIVLNITSNIYLKNNISKAKKIIDDNILDSNL